MPEPEKVGTSSFERDMAEVFIRNGFIPKNIKREYHADTNTIVFSVECSVGVRVAG